ncbi:MAG: hypothetical protein CL928_14845 [Deltaproteobacteria bacterium]|nr:hypothetical protein [Deltaproteobacteria bacterium]
MTVAPGSLGDGDDSASAGARDRVPTGDDDDSWEPEPQQVTAEYTFSYYGLVDGIPTDLYCDQRIDATGEAVFGPDLVPDAGCNNCTGYITMDPTTVNDVSDPGSNPTDCDPLELNDLGFQLLDPQGGEPVDVFNSSFGMHVLTPLAEGGVGDFLSMALVDADAMHTLGLYLAQGVGASPPGFSAADMQATLDVDGLELSHAGYVDNVTGSYADHTGLNEMAASAGGSSTWLGFWQISRDPAENTHDAADMNGVYGGQMIWWPALFQ